MYVVFTALSSILLLVIPFVSSQVIIHLTGENYNELAVFAGILFGVIALQIAIGSLGEWLYGLVYRRMRFDVRKNVAESVMQMNLQTISDKGSGFFFERLSEDVTEASAIHLDIYNNIIKILTNLGFVGYITVLNPILGAIFAVGLAVLVWLEYYRVSHRLKLTKQTKRAREKLKSDETEVLKGIKEIKSQGARTAILDKHSAASSKYADSVYRNSLFGTKINGAIMIIRALTDLAILLFAGLYLLPNPSIMVEVAAVLVIYNYKGNIYGFISALANIRDTYVNGELSAKRLNDILKAPVHEYDRFGTANLDGGVKEIEFSRVQFSYKPDVPVLRDISFKIDRNGLYGFVGKSGSGKSTIFSLLSNFYKATDGKMKINGINFDELSESAVRGAITCVLQDPYIFNDTLLGNIKFARADATNMEIHKACAAANLHNEIMEFENGYDTVIGESGSNLSGGQKQRLEIARALLKKSSVLLMDEATSALDKGNLTIINTLMKNLAREKIVMVIAHRLGIMRQCDRVFVLDQGKIIASGTHEQLMETCEYYQELFKKQQTTETAAAEQAAAN